jgi:hypothetical protein
LKIKAEDDGTKAEASANQSRKENDEELSYLCINGNIDHYVENRFKGYIRNCRKEWRKLWKREQFLQYIIIVVGALIPIVNVNVNVPYTNYVSAILGGGIVISTGILQFQKYHERWLIEKSTKAKLMNEFFCYNYKIKPYDTTKSDNSERGRLFVDRCETIMMLEATDFVALFNSINARQSSTTTNTPPSPAPVPPSSLPSQSGSSSSSPSAGQSSTLEKDQHQTQ